MCQIDFLVLKETKQLCIKIMCYLFSDSGMPKGILFIINSTKNMNLGRSNYDEKLMGTFSICKTKNWCDQKAKSIKIQVQIYRISWWRMLNMIIAIKSLIMIAWTMLN